MQLVQRAIRVSLNPVGSMGSHILLSVLENGSVSDSYEAIWGVGGGKIEPQRFPNS